MSGFSRRIKPFRFLIILFLISAIIFPFSSLFADLAVIAYSIYPPFLNVGRLIHREEYADLILEFQWLKILLVFLLPPFIIFEILINVSNQFSNPCMLFPCDFVTRYFPVLLTYFTVGVCIRTLAFVVRKEIREDLTKWCCRIISKTEDDFEKMKFLRILLESYDRYLKRRLKVGIDENKIFSIILSKSAEEKSQVINQICKSLDGDKLNLAKYLSSIYKISDSEFYIRETFVQQLKPIGLFLAAAIPIIISILTFLRR